MKKLLKLLRSATRSDVEKDVLQCIIDFKDGINKKVCKRIDDKILMGHFTEIWSLLLKLSANSSVNVRLELFSTIYFFIVKTYPYYPRLIRESFSKSISAPDFDDYSSVAVCASFSYLSNWMGPYEMESFLDNTPVFHFFVQKQTLVSDYLPQIVSNLGCLDSKWYKHLFSALINRIGGILNNHMLNALTKLIRRDSFVLISELFSIANNHGWNEKFFSLISHLVLSKIEIPKEIDICDLFFALGQKLLKRINESELNDIFIVISGLYQHYDSNYDNGELVMSYKDLKINLLYDKYQNNKFFFMLPLPLSLLTPNKINENSIIEVKLDTIGRLFSNPNLICDVSLPIKILSHVDNPYMVLNSLSLCINTLIINSKSHELGRLLRRVLFVQPKCWYDASIIIKVFKSSNLFLLRNVIGYNGCLEILDRCLQFLSYKNLEFLEELYSTIIYFSKNLSFYDTTNRIVYHCDIFCEDSIESHAHLLDLVIKSNPKEDIYHIYSFVYSMFESLPMIPTSLSFLTTILRFLSHFNMLKMPPYIVQGLCDSSVAILTSTLDFLKGYKKKTKLDSNYLSDYQEQISKFFASKSIDVVTKNACDLRCILQPVYSSICFLLSLPFEIIDKKFVVLISQQLFCFFPYECSCFINKWLPELDSHECMKIITRLSTQLDIVSDIRVFGIWCGIALNNITNENNDQIQIFKANSLRIAQFFILNPQLSNIEEQTVFAALLGTDGDNYMQLIANYITSLCFAEATVFLDIARKRFPVFDEKFNSPMYYLDNMIKVNIQNNETMKFPFLRNLDEIPKSAEMIYHWDEIIIGKVEYNQIENYCYFPNNKISLIDYQNRFEHFLIQNNPIMSLCILYLSLIEEKSLEYQHLDIMDSIFDEVLSKQNLDCDEKKLLLFSPCLVSDFNGYPSEAIIYQFKLHSALFLEDLINRTSLTKREVILSGDIISQIGSNNQFLDIYIQTVLSYKKNTYWIISVFRFISSICRFKTISESQFNMFYHYIIANMAESPVEAVKSLFYLSKHGMIESQDVYCNDSSSFLILIALRRHDVEEFSLNNVITNELSINKPSSFINVLRILTQCCLSLKQSSVISLISNVLPKIIKSYNNYCDNPMVISTLKVFFEAAFQIHELIIPLCTDFYLQTVDNPHTATFIDLIGISAIIPSSINLKKSIFHQLSNRIENAISLPNISSILSGLDFFSALLSKSNDLESKHKVIQKFNTIFFESNFKDVYQIHHIISSYIQVLNAHFSQEIAIPYSSGAIFTSENLILHKFIPIYKFLTQTTSDSDELFTLATQTEFVILIKSQRSNILQNLTQFPLLTKLTQNSQFTRLFS